MRNRPSALSRLLPALLLVLSLLLSAVPGARAQNFGGITTAPIWQVQGDAITGQADGAGLASWPATVGPTPTQTVSGRDPIYHSTGGPNGHPYVTFTTGTAQQLVTSSLTQAAGSYDIFAVVRLPNTTGNHWLMDSQTGRLILFNDNNNGSGPGFYDGAFHLFSPVLNASWHVLEWKLSGGTSTLYEDGTALGTSTYTATPLGGFTVLGNSTDAVTGAGAGTNGAGDVAQTNVYAAALSTSDGNAVGSALAAKYGLTTAYAAPAAPPSFLPNDPGLLYSPYNWLVTASSAKTINSGAYFRTLLNATTTCKIGLNVGAAVPYSQVYARLDGGPWQLYVPTAGGPQLWALTMPTVNNASNHLLEFVVKCTTQTVAGGQDRWTNQGTAVQFTGLTLDAGATLSLPAARKYRVLIYGDSITEGVHVNGNAPGANELDLSDVLLDYSYRLGELLDAEVGIVGFGGTGLTVGGSSNVPQLTVSYNQLWNGQARAFSPQPDEVIFNEGTNEPSANVTSALSTVVNGIGLSTPTGAGFAGTHFLILRPFGGQNWANLQAAVAAINSPNVALGDTSSLPAVYTGDGVHPYGLWQQAYAAPAVALLSMGTLHPGGLSASDEALLASIAGLQRAGQPVTLPALPPVTLAANQAVAPVTLAPTQSFNNTGQTSAPGWLGVNSVLLPADHAAIATDVQAGLTAQGWTTALVTQLAAQVARIYGAEWGTVTQTSTGYSVAMPAGALTIPAPGAVIGTVAPTYDSTNKLINQTKTVN